MNNLKAQTRADQAGMTPDSAIVYLKAGNERFVTKTPLNRDLVQQVSDTSNGQFPFATILSCIDSRVPAEVVFDQGIGDIFSARIAGNFINTDLLGSMEFACKLAGTKVIMVLGHTLCGAVKGACDDAKMGNLTSMLGKIKPAVRAVTEPADPALRNSKNVDFVNNVVAKNVELTIERIRDESEVLANMEELGDIKIVGAIYDIHTGKVSYL